MISYCQYPFTITYIVIKDCEESIHDVLWLAWYKKVITPVAIVVMVCDSKEGTNHQHQQLGCFVSWHIRLMFDTQ